MKFPRAGKILALLVFGVGYVCWQKPNPEKTGQVVPNVRWVSHSDDCITRTNACYLSYNLQKVLVIQLLSGE